MLITWSNSLILNWNIPLTRVPLPTEIVFLKLENPISLTTSNFALASLDIDTRFLLNYVYKHISLHVSPWLHLLHYWFISFHLSCFISYLPMLMISTSLFLTKLTVTLTFNNGQKFVIINIGSFHYFLDIQAHCNTNGLFICQTKYIQDILTKETIIDAKYFSSPTSTTKLGITSGDVLDDPTHYWSRVGALTTLLGLD